MTKKSKLSLVCFYRLQKMKHRTTNHRPDLIFLVLVVTSLFMFCYSIVLSQESDLSTAQQSSGNQLLESAEKLYYNREFDEAKEIVNRYLQENPALQDDQIRAYKILVRINLVQGDSIQAKENVRKLLTIDSDYEPTIEQETPNYVNLIAVVKLEQSQLAEKTEASGSQLKKWLIIGAGGVAAAAIIVLAATGKESEQENKFKPLPEPPNFP
jgi:hypothetical protein